MKAIIEAKRLTRTFGNLVAVDHLEFGVYQGEIFGFLGPNGAGKTTTVRMLTGVIDPTEYILYYLP
jgi:ABC-2 type transport system ATP-binding protein